MSAIDPVAINILNAKGPYNGFLFPSGSGQPWTGYLGVGLMRSRREYISPAINITEGWITNSLSAAYPTTWASFISLTPTSFSTPGEPTVLWDKFSPYQYKLMNNTFSIHDLQTFRPNLLNEITLGVTYAQRDIQNVNQVTVGDIGMERFNSSLVSGTPNAFLLTDSLAVGASTTVGETHSGNNESEDFP